MPNDKSIMKLCVIMAAFTSLFVISIAILISNNIYFGNTNLAYGHTNQMNSNITNLKIQNIPEKKIHVGDIDIAYEIFGRGDPILFIAGATMTIYNWPPSIINQLSLNHMVIVFDNRGVGNTTCGTKPFSIQQFAIDTNGLLDALKIQKADVLGFSLGSLIAQELTVTHPEKVNRLVLYSSTCGGEDSIPPSPPVLKSYIGVIRNTTDTAKRLVSTLFPQGWIKANPNYFASILLSKEKAPETTIKLQLSAFTKWGTPPLNGSCDQLGILSKPILIIVGTKDMAIPPANSLIIAAKIPGSWLVQIRGGGHGLMHQYPEQFSNILNTFLEIA